MLKIGTPGTANTTLLCLLGAGELGREVAIAALRLGLEVMAVDRYAGAPAMALAHHARVIDMSDPAALSALLREVRPAYIVPEIEAIATSVLAELEAEGMRVIPNARAVHLTMDREGIRNVAAAQLGLPTSPYRFAGDPSSCAQAIREIGTPCYVKPVMSSSGKGQIRVTDMSEADDAYARSVAGGRGAHTLGDLARVIIEGHIAFDYEITLLTLRHGGTTSFCAPIGHLQVDGDYRESWQPQPMASAALASAQAMAMTVTEALGGHGIFGVEFFIQDEQCYFSEISPRPHDTGMVTMVSQDRSQFELHLRAILGLPIAEIVLRGPAASCAIVGHGDSAKLSYTGLEAALAVPGAEIRMFGKPEIKGKRRLGVALARGDDIKAARARARQAAAAIAIDYGPS